MRASSRMVAVLLAAAVWVYAAMSAASSPMAPMPITPSVLDAAARAVRAVVD